MWMSYLSQVQPWLSGPEMDLHRSLAGRIRQLIGRIVDERAWRISGSAPPEWFSRLVLCWHERQAVIITLNYDTLIESAARAGVPEEPRTGETLQDNKRHILPGQIYPSYFTNVAARGGAGLWGEESLKTFRLLKLHGSVNWYYSGREIFFGETIFYNDIPEFEIPEDENARSKKLGQLMGLVGDKEMLIIPPVSEKTTYFNNETIRALWKEAGEALREASTVYIIGYSLPPSDLGMQMFLRGNQPTPKTHVFVVDINPKVVKHIGNHCCPTKIRTGEDLKSSPVL